MKPTTSCCARWWTTPRRSTPRRRSSRRWLAGSRFEMSTVAPDPHPNPPPGGRGQSRDEVSRTSGATLLDVNGIEVIYNHVILVLKGVSLAVPDGGIVALLGGNGAGKTTTLKAISNLLQGERGEVTKGAIHFDGQRVDALNPSELVKRG